MVWLVKPRENSPWPTAAFRSREDARALSRAVHGDLGDEGAFVRPVELFRDVAAYEEGARK